MTKDDIRRFNEDERRTLDAAFDRDYMDRQVRLITLSTLLASCALVAALLLPGTRLLVTGLFLALLIIVTLEKTSYLRLREQNQRLIRKLVRRVEELEGVRVTPMGAEPSVRSVTEPAHPAFSDAAE